ncbi:MAG TPA: glycosyltransferase [Gemmatimonadaceae bacterium]|nr:glycosyltransferase [Gemmatimonadaceae bacterium]
MMARTLALSVVVCTRERPDDLERCLVALGAQRAPLEVIVVDNAPRTGRTRAVATRAGVRYVVEPRPGLDCARNAGLRAATAPVVAYTDDDAVADPEWAEALLAALDDQSVTAVAGAILPFEIETEAQRLFERYLRGEAGRRDQGKRRIFVAPFPPAAAGHVGAGANMAFRRDALEALGGFDEAFDAGTLTRSGGDTEMFARLLGAGARLVYEPGAVVRHRHRRELRELREQLFGYGVGVYAFWMHRVLRHRDVQAARFAAGTFFRHGGRRLRRSALHRPDELPLALVLAELLGCLYGPIAYLRARRRAGAPPAMQGGSASP